MTSRLNRGKVALGALVCSLVALAAPAGAGAMPVSLTTNQTAFSDVTLSLAGDPSPELLDRVTLKGRIQFPGPGQKVAVTVKRDGHRIVHRQLPTDPISGRYRMRLKLTGCCEYLAQVSHGTEVSYPLAFETQVPETLEAGPLALLFNRLLSEHGFHNDAGDELDDGTGLAIMAMRKTNEFEMSEDYDPELFTMLLQGRGEFEPVNDDDGRHVEVDISRQVMALVEDGEATDVFHVSTGAGGTPRGDFNFYSKTPGYNQKGMYYSVFYDGNYATHGYYSVPTYPASHGCVRNPEAYSVFIYDWIDIGDPMYVYD